MRVYANSRDKILAAAEELVAEQGAGKLTLDAVAKRAGISKGGLIHNFASKEQLLQAMVEHMLHLFQQRLAAEKAKEAPTPTGEFKTILRLGLELDEQFLKVSSGLLAAASAQPKLLEPVRTWYHQYYSGLAKGDLKFPLAAILALASDGMYLLNLLGLLSLTGEQKKQVEEEILKLAETCGRE